MITFFRKLLIRSGKVIPFLFAAIVTFGYGENLYAIATDMIIIDANGEMFYDCPISAYIADIVYIDWFDVLLLYVLAVALEFCWRNMLAVHYLLLNLAVRAALEHVSMSDGTIISIASFMALAGLYCVYGGIKILLSSRKQ